jgi:UDP-glucose 4-epimerase
MKEKNFDFIKNKNVLITGGSGFIGYYLSEICHLHGANIYGIDINAPRNNSVWKEFVCAKLSDVSLNSFNPEVKFDYIYHLAGSASVPLSFDFPTQDFDSLLPPTLALIEYMKKQSKDSKLITFSSAAVYGNPEVLPIGESFNKEPISPYGIHKLLNENLIEFYANLYKIDCTVIRVFSAYGEGLTKQLFWDVMQKYKMNNECLELYGTGNETRDFIHIKDVVRGALFVTQGAFKNNFNVFNLGSGKETAIKDAVKFLFLKAHIKPEIIFQGQNRIGNPINWKADIEKIESLGFKTKYDIDKTLSNYADWFFEIDAMA